MMKKIDERKQSKMIQALQNQRSELQELMVQKKEDFI